MKNKSTFIFLLLLLIGLVAAIVSAEPENCWDKYPTEQQAIKMCEQH